MATSSTDGADLEQRIRELAGAWHYPSEIARMLDVPVTRVSYLASIHGIDIPRHTEVKKRRMKDLCGRGYYSRDICEQLGLTRSAVRMFCKRHQIKRNIPPRLGSKRPIPPVNDGQNPH